MKNFLCVLAACLCAVGVFSLTSTLDSKAQTAKKLYIWGYPAVLMEISKRVMTNTDKLTPSKAPLGVFLNKTTFPDPTFTDVVSPNADTLYSSAWLDLSSGPYILSVPEIKDRYYLMELLDGWTNVFASLGTRTTGTDKQSFAIVGPNWQGSLPSGVKEVRSPTNLVWILGRTQTRGAADYGAVHKIQEQYKLVPLQNYGKPPLPATYPAPNSKIPNISPAEQVAKLDGVEFFTLLNEVLHSDIPPQKIDAPLADDLATLGIGQYLQFDPSKWSEEEKNEINQAAKEAYKEIVSTWNSHKDLSIVNGWGILRDKVGNYGDDYTLRAVVAYGGLGANLPEDAIYPAASTDDKGEPLNGKNNYVIHFNEAPPVDAFWSITMYNDKQFFVANPINRYAIGSNDGTIQKNQDGSFNIYIQNKSPGKDKESNWLPAPEGSFNLLMRLYQPKEAVLNGTWEPPVIQKQSS